MRSARRAAGAAALLAALVASGCGGGGTAGSSTSQPTARTAGPSPAARRAEHRVRAMRRAQAEEAEMVRGDEGWERSRAGLFWTPDGGRSWRSITPPVPDSTAPSSVHFASPRGGWALAELGREGATHPVVFTTLDGGRSWRHARLPLPELLLPAASASFAPAGGDRVFLLLKQEGDTASNVGFLLESSDGGRSWQSLPRPPQAGQISFESGRDGWLAGGFPGSKLWRTEDGGRSWTQVKLAGLPETGGHWVSYLPPRISAGGRGLLPTVWPGSEGLGTRAILYSTADAGRTWKRLSSTRLPQVNGSLEADGVFSPRGPGRSLLMHDPVTGAIALVRADGRVEPFRPSHGLPEWSRIDLSDASNGFALSPFRHPPKLAVTGDGGRRWSPVRLPGSKPHGGSS
jgi:photosystem II stability/assembly factor-like uncharacterized protein